MVRVSRNTRSLQKITAVHCLTRLLAVGTAQAIVQCLRCFPTSLAKTVRRTPSSLALHPVFSSAPSHSVSFKKKLTACLFYLVGDLKTEWDWEPVTEEKLHYKFLLVYSLVFSSGCPAPELDNSYATNKV